MESIIGKKFNLLTVIKDTGKRTDQRTKILLCLCDCGKYKEIAREKLRHGTKSCGCLKAKNLYRAIGKDHNGWEGYGDISKSFYSRIKHCAKLRSYEFNVSIEYLWEIFLKQNKKCPLSGIDLEMPINVRKLRDKSDQKLASLDRINNDLGYIEGNVRWVCKRINYMKHIMNDPQFLFWVKKIYEYQNSPAVDSNF